MAPRSFNTSDTATLPLYDLERGGKAVNVSTKSVPSDRPVLGRRKTSENLVTDPHSHQSQRDQKKGLNTDEDTLTKVGNFIFKIHSSNIVFRYALYIIPVAALLAVPLVLTTQLKVPDASQTKPVGFCIWAEVIWVALWVCKLVAKTFPIIFRLTAGLISTGVRKYALVLKALEIPISLLLWSIVAWATLPVIWHFKADYVDTNVPGTPWANMHDNMTKAFVALIVVCAIFLGEKTIIQLVGINYHHKQYEHKIQQSKKMILLLDMLYDASRRIFPEFCREFEQEDMDIQGNALQVREGLAKVGVRTKVFNELGRAGDKVTAAFGAMASDISGKQVFKATSAHAIVVEALESQRASKALARRLWFSFAGENKDALYKEDLDDVLGISRHEEAEEIFALLDRDLNGDVSLDEMTTLVVGAGLERKNRAKSMADIGEAIGVLDKLLSTFVLIAVVFVYLAFFNTLGSNGAQIWTAVTGLAFAIGGTVTEFLSCCIFLFVKHPYDVGDRVDITQGVLVELVVEHISLMYTVFRRIDSDKIVQIPHNVANTLWVENVSRSRHMKERYEFSVSAATSQADLETLRGQLEKFVRTTDNRRDFKEDVEIQLVSLGDMKQLDLRVEIRHKSNFANEVLRQTRRNKFMCELLAAMRAVPIEPPGGSGAPLGDPSNPSYNVSVSDGEAITARAQKAEELDAKRLFPKNAAATSGFEAFDRVAENPINGIFNAVTGRRSSTMTSRTARSSIESMMGRAR